MTESKKEKNLFQTIEDREKRIAKTALDILQGMYMAYKNIKIYDLNNLLVNRQISSVFHQLKELLKSEGEVIFTLRLNTLYLNVVKVHFSFSNYYLFKFLGSLLIQREIGLLRFTDKLSKEELGQFMCLIGKKEVMSKEPFDSFAATLQKNQITNILIEKIQSFEESQRNVKNAKKIFFLGITHLKEMFNSLKKDERVPISTTRRLMQSIFNNIVENESFSYGLTTIKNFDEYTLNHSINVCILSISLGKRLGLDRNELAELGISAFFHDFGKTEIPKEILVKPGKLDERERKIIEKHPYLGAEKLIRLKETSHLPVRAINVAMEHHVKEDLTGYPIYQKKRHINLYSKIVKICDVYDALTTKRPYRDKAFTRDETIGMMMENIGTQFDPIILKVFSNMMGHFPVGSLVLLNTGEIGIVFESNPEPSEVLRPKVKIITDRDGNKIDGDIVDLNKKDSYMQDYKKKIIKSLDPDKYQIQVADYFLVLAQ
jgi:HD-GYP domain-containing protein (c-di-GMP phosphodiesterase class II)